jgi:acyl-CoA thioester hydrolase
MRQNQSRQEMTAQETLFSYAHQSECAEPGILSGHAIVQRLEEADRQFRLICGLSESLVGARRVRHIRFHETARCGALLVVSSFICFDGPHILTVVHQMKNVATGALLATSIDGYTPPTGTARTFRSKFKDIVLAMPDEAAPKALPPSPAGNKATLDSVLASGGSIVYRGTVLPRHLGADSKADDGFVAQCITEALPHVWQLTPLGIAWQQETGSIRHLYETKLSWISPLKAGESFVMTASLTGTQANMLGARFFMFESRAGRLCAVNDAAFGPVSKETGQPVDLPPGTQDAVSRLRSE